MTLTAEQLRLRAGKLTASRVSALMTGDPEKILDLWRELVGDPHHEDVNLDEFWAVRLGETTEILNLDWISERLGPIVRRGEVVTHACGWAACTLDGWIDRESIAVETKHCGGFEKADVIHARYMPQMHWIMHCTGTRRIGLSVIYGAKQPVVDFIPFNNEYGVELVERAETFMDCVRRLIPPVSLPSVAPPVVAEKTYDMRGNNLWASAAVQWLENRGASVKAADAVKSLKEMTPADAIKAEGHGVRITRNRAGALSLKEE